MKCTPRHITELKPDEVFVFGSNLAGIHGAGAARTACSRFGAIRGVGEGLQGQSYALPTKGRKLEVRSLKAIRPSVLELLRCALQHPEKEFLVTPVGCGLAGYTAQEIAPLFLQIDPIPPNISLPKSFWEVISPTPLCQN